jgi:hypothetical protein
LALRLSLKRILSKMPPPPPSKLRRQIQANPSKRPIQPFPNNHPQFTKLHVLTTFSSDSSTPSVVLSTQTYQYVFNCGEGMQRLCQSKYRMPRYCDIFLTRVAWDVAGGLPGSFTPGGSYGRILIDVGRVRGFKDSGSRS